MSSRLSKLGFWSGIILVILGIAYISLVVAVALSGSGFPPVEPFQTMVNFIVLFTAVWIVIFWVVLHQSTSMEKKIFSQISLSFIIIFAGLTSINRYVGLTVVRQSLISGNINGLQWFLPYGWPSVMLALEFLGWGFFFGLACLFLSPAFSSGKLERSIFWTLIVIGIFSLFASIGQFIGFNLQSLNPFVLFGTIAWGPGLTLFVVLMMVWFRNKEKTVLN